jgi:hypothetical protein
VILGFMANAGFERDYGRRVVGDLDAAGLTEIRGEGRARLIDPTSPGFDFFRLSFESLRGTIVDAEILTTEQADAASAGFSENVRLLTPMMMAGMGRRG